MEKPQSVLLQYMPASISQPILASLGVGWGTPSVTIVVVVRDGIAIWVALRSSYHLNGVRNARAGGTHH